MYDENMKGFGDSLYTLQVRFSLREWAR